MKSILINGKRWIILKKRFSAFKNAYIYTIQDEDGNKEEVNSITSPKLAKTLDNAETMKGDTGHPGKDGHTPIPGIDFFTKEDRDSMVNEVVAECMASIKQPKDGKDGMNGVSPRAGVDYPTMAQLREWASKEVTNLVLKLQKPAIQKEVRTVIKEAEMTKDEIKDFIRKNIPKPDLIRGGGDSFTGLAKVDTADIPGNLEDKVIAGSNITITKGTNSDGTKKLTIASTGGGSGTPGGADTQVQFNDGGSFGGDTTFTFDKTNDVLGVHKIAGDATDGLIIEASNGTDIGILGAGNNANATWYGSHNYDIATANTIASFGASKTLSSLPLTTYPSLTELSYVKGVTSAIQTQLDAKLDDSQATAFGLSLLDDVDAAAGRTTLGLVAGGTGDIWVEKAGDSMTGQLNIGVAGNALIARNTTDAASVQTAIFEGDRATMADGDEAYISMRLSNDAGTQTEVSRITWVADDVNVGTDVDSSLVFSVASAGVLNQELYLNPFFLFPASNDGLALGTSTNGFSDLFLASGAVINFNNGDVTITHSADQLTIGGGALSLNANALDNVGTYTASTAGVIRTRTSAGNTLLIKARDVDGASDTTFITLTANNTPTCDLDDAVTKAGNYIYRAGGTDVPITDGGTGASDAATAFSNLKQAASLTATGVVELATTAEINTGTDSTRAIPVDQFVASARNVRYFEIPITQDKINVVAETGIRTWECPITGTITEIGAYVVTAGTTGTMQVDVNLNAATIMTTNKITIDSTETSSRTAATAPALTTTAISAGDLLTFDIDTIQTTPAKGLYVRFAIRLT